MSGSNPQIVVAAWEGKHLIDFASVLDWLRNPNRKPAHLQFTSGTERRFADEIELAIQRATANLQSQNRELASTVEILRADLEVVDERYCR